jgi:hypothetical protein
MDAALPAVTGCSDLFCGGCAYFFQRLRLWPSQWQSPPVPSSHSEANWDEEPDLHSPLVTEGSDSYNSDLQDHVESVPPSPASSFQREALPPPSLDQQPDANGASGSSLLSVKAKSEVSSALF